MKITRLLLLLLLSSINVGCSFFYVAKQGAYQLKLLAGATPIEHALRSLNLDSKQRKKLILITEIRHYCREHLKLVADKNYKDVNLSWKNIIYNVSASEKLEFKSYTWWFPVIGSVPYKGYFEEEDADIEIDRLKKLGFDTLKRRVGGYSTLGYFSDPVWPTMLEMRDEALVELIIHELAHATIYIANQTPFNETFANFVGKTGARMFYVDKFGENSEEVKNLDKYNNYEKIYNKFFSDLYADLDHMYMQNISISEKEIEKSKILHEAFLKYKNSALYKEYPVNNWNINNAYLLAFKAYNYDEAVFSDLFSLVNYNFENFLYFVKSISREQDPFVALRKYLNKHMSDI